jgi:predicted RNA-binding protein
MVADYRTIVNNIRIPANIEPGQGKVILSNLDSLYAEVRILYGDILKQSKEIDRQIYRIENKNKNGANEGARRCNMVTAVENAQRGDGATVNLYEIEIEVMKKKEDLEAILDVIEKKISMIITMNGLLKLESSLA